MLILVIDDDPDLVDLLSFILQKADFRVVGAYDAPRGLQLLDKEQPDLVVLDINLGAWEGFQVLRDIRRHSAVPVIILTARGQEKDKVLGLDLGATDYVTKPFGHHELIARIRAHLRDYPKESPATGIARTLQVGPLTMNVAEHTVEMDGCALHLTVTEFRLLHYLMTHTGEVLPTQDILKQVWGYEDHGNNELVRVTVHRLRYKIGDDPRMPRLLYTVPGVGIMLKTEATQPP
jgi:DNA-binding response OmpR family regulator